MHRDLNQPYVPARYPMMLYAALDHHVTVHDEAAEGAARKNGFTDFAEVDADRDHLEQREHGWLVDHATALYKTALAGKNHAELIETVRELRAVASLDAAGAANTDDPDFDAMTDDVLRAHVAAVTGQTPHYRLGRDKLLALARSELVITA